jgi:hypothetical protein
LSVSQRKKETVFDKAVLRDLSSNEADDIEKTWNLSHEKKILDEKQKKLKEAIAMRPAAYSPVEFETGRLW